MDDLINDRTPVIIAAEINTIKYHAGKVMVSAIIEIGRRLKEAKALLAHGEWLKWLEESVSYSRKTAANYIRLYEEYGDQELVFPNGKTFSHLSCSQALILLGVPEEERSQFIAEVDVESMSARELQKAVKGRNQAEEERDQAKENNANLQKTVDDQAGMITQLTAECENLKNQAEGLRQSQSAMEISMVKLRSELSKTQESKVFKKCQTTSRSLHIANTKLIANKIGFMYDTLNKDFNDLVWEMQNFAKKEPEIHEMYRVKIMDFLSAGLREKF